MENYLTLNLVVRKVTARLSKVMNAQMFITAGLIIWKFMTMVNHSRFLYCVRFLGSKIELKPSEAEYVSILTCNGGNATLTLVQLNVLFCP
jgi:hypothetical protein